MGVERELTRTKQAEAGYKMASAALNNEELTRLRVERLDHRLAGGGHRGGAVLLDADPHQRRLHLLDVAALEHPLQVGLEAGDRVRLHLGNAREAVGLVLRGLLPRNLLRLPRSHASVAVTERGRGSVNGLQPRPWFM